MKTTTFICTSVAMVAVTLLAGCGGGGSGEGNVRPATPDPTVLLPAGHGIPAGMYTVEPGTTEEYGNVAVSCPTGGMACVVNVASSDGATATYEEAGGTPTVEVVTGMVNLPSGHAIPAASYTIEPGTTEEYGNVAVSCPSGGMACVVNVASSDAATATYEQTGGTPTIETASGVVNLPTGHAIPTARYTIEPGATVEYGNVTISCPSGGMACVLNVASSDAATATYVQTGGTPTIETAAGVVSLPAGHAIPAASYTIEPGATEEYGNVAVSCPSGGMACVVNVASSDAATATYEETGGTPTVEVVTGMVNLPTGHAIPAASYTIEPGATVEYGNVAISCPSGGMACVVSVASLDAATATYEQTGGTPTIETVTGMVNLPTGHAIPTARYTIEPGATVEYGNVVVSCPAGGMACVVNVASSDAATATYVQTGGTPAVASVLIDLAQLPQHHGISVADNVSIEPGNVHHGQHGVSVVCPAGGMACVVDFAADAGKYHKTGGMPEIQTHRLVWAAHDQVGRAGSIFTRMNQADEDSGENPVGYRLHNVRTTVNHTGSEVTFEVVYPDPNVDREAREPMLLDGLGTADHKVDSNIPEFPGWTGMALSRDDAAAGLTLHANVYTDIEPDRGGIADLDYMVLGVWLEVPDDIGQDSALVGVFVDGSDPFTSGNIVDLTGTARYQGPAIGMYEERIVGSSDNIRIGSFEASADLNANFDATAGAGGSISGTITGFEENGQSLGDWVVRLTTTTGIDSSNRVQGNPEISRDDGRSFIGGIGDWEAAFYGNGEMRAEHPASIAGSFWADVGSRTAPVLGDQGYLGLVGAFGARRP